MSQFEPANPGLNGWKSLTSVGSSQAQHLVYVEMDFYPCSVQFSRSVVSDSLWPHEPQHARPPCPSPAPRVHPKPRPLSRWCHPTILSSVFLFFSCPQSFPASGSFPVSQLFTSIDQSIGVSASASVLPMNIQDWSPLGWTSWISVLPKGLLSLLQHHSLKASILQHSIFFTVGKGRNINWNGSDMRWSKKSSFHITRDNGHLDDDTTF